MLVLCDNTKQKSYFAASHSQESNIVKRRGKMCRRDIIQSDPLLQNVFTQPQVIRYRRSPT